MFFPAAYTVLLVNPASTQELSAWIVRQIKSYLKHMREKGKEGASFKEFQQVLPNLSRDQITVLLRGLRRENRAYCAGKTSASRWFAGSMSTADIEL